MNHTHLSAAIAVATAAAIVISVAWWRYKHPHPGLFRGGSVTNGTIDYRFLNPGDLVASRSTTTGVILPRDVPPGGVIFHRGEDAGHVRDGNPSDTRDLQEREMSLTQSLRRPRSSLTVAGFVRVCAIATGVFFATDVAAIAQGTNPDPVIYGPKGTCAGNLDKTQSSIEVLTSDSMRRIIANMQSLNQDYRSILGEQNEKDAESAIATCPSGPQRDLLRAYVSSWRGFIEHYIDNEAWRDDLNLSDQLFSACVRQSAGTAQGARCATGIERNARWRRAWGP